MRIDVTLPAPGRRELVAIGGAAALAVLGVVEGPVALVLAAVPLIRAHLTPRADGSQGAAHLHLDTDGHGPRVAARGSARTPRPSAVRRRGTSAATATTARPRATTARTAPAGRGRRTTPSG